MPPDDARAEPSLPSRWLSAVLRHLVKRRSRHWQEVAFIRSAVELSLRLHLPYLDTRIRTESHPALRGEWVIPTGAPPSPVVLYLHGGGYFFCSPRTHRPLTMSLARLGGFRVFAVRYRLAPEHPFPAALHDALRAWDWLLAAGHEPSRIAVAGDSAGGGLTLALQVALRDRGSGLPAASVCISPWTDLAGTGASLEFNDAHCAMFHGEGVRRGASHYVGETDPRHPLVSPLYADLRGLPPLLVQVSDSEVLLDDSTRLADRAREAGVDTTLEIWPRQPHIWPLWAPFVPEGREALARACRFLDRHMPVPSRRWTSSLGR